MSEGWSLRLLGPLEVRRNGVQVPIAAPKQRVILALLALAANRTVSVERLIVCLWGERSPSTARNSLRNYVMRLRRILETDTAPSLLVTAASGYRLDLADDAIDVYRFDALLRGAQSYVAAGESESALALLEEALALWRGDPLVDVPSDVLHREVVPGLRERRLAALESRVEVALQLGRHGELITELTGLTANNPLRERMWAHLMLALYRSGRTADALNAYHQAGKALADELGIDPGPELQALHQAVLTNDPGLILAGPKPSGAGRHRAAPAVLPRQLPAPAAQFVGRVDELRHISARLDAARGSSLVVVSAIGGTAGVGKTALAVHWGHLHADRFPDGQLYVNLRGFDPGCSPTPPTTVVYGFLVALGVPAQQIPAELDQQVALYRSHLAGRRMLIVLDNARDADQVRPLLPGAPGPMVLVTSRNQLAGLVALDGAVPLVLDLLTPAEAGELLTRHLGRERVEREQDVAGELIEACARLPLALNIAAARAALRPAWPLAELVAELRDSHQRLDTLSIGEATADIRAVFSWSYRTLSPAAARTFRLLGLHPGMVIDLAAVAGLTGLELAETRRALDELTGAHLLTERSVSRYSLHDLLRAYAVDQLKAHDSEVEQDEALRRLIDFYTRTAYTADQMLDPHRAPIPLDFLATDARPHPLPDVPAVMAWFDTEHQNLLACQQAAIAHGWHLTVWQLAWVLTNYHRRRGHRDDRLAVWRAASDAAEHLPDPKAKIRIRTHRLLSTAYTEVERHSEASDHLHKALALADRYQDPTEQAQTHRLLAWVSVQRGDDRQALHHAIRALEVYRALDQPAGVADLLNVVGWCAARLGEYDTARSHCEEALTLHRRLEDREGEANTLDTLGYNAHQMGDHEQAIDRYQQSLALFRDIGNLYEAAGVLDRLGASHLAGGQAGQARAAWREALELFQRQDREQDADRVRRRLAAMDHLGDP